MALFGRAFPIRAHLAKPLVSAATSPPIVTKPQIVGSVTKNQAFASVARLKPHLVPAIRTFLPLTTKPFVISAVKANACFLQKKGNVKTAKPVTGSATTFPPLWTRAFVISSVKANNDKYMHRFSVKHAGPVVSSTVILGASEDWFAQPRLGDYRAFQRLVDFTANDRNDSQEANRQ